MSEHSIYYEQYTEILKNELVPAMGCTEPIAIAYCAAKARSLSDDPCTKVIVEASGNIIKNVKSVTVPNTNGLKGIEAAAAVGIVAGDPEKKLEVISSVSDAQKEELKSFLKSIPIEVRYLRSPIPLDMIITLETTHGSNSVRIAGSHDHIIWMKQNDKVIYEDTIQEEEAPAIDTSFMSVEGILDYATHCALESVKPTLDRQIQYNMAIAQRGLEQNYGANIGKILLARKESSLLNKVKAYAAAGSDARMSGCSLPVVINSGSGNQGITVSMPVYTYAEEWNISEDKLYRALCISNLVSVHIKYFIGSLSAFCGAVSAACGSGAAIAYMYGAGYDQIGQTIINTLGNVGGIVCDGAKSSCAAKISSAVNAALLGFQMAIEGKGFQNGEGIVLEDVEQTIKSMGHVGRVGMAGTDIDILNIMIGKTDVNE